MFRAKPNKQIVSLSYTEIEGQREHLRATSAGNIFPVSPRVGEC
jgi:hypothetical protein